MAAALTEFAVVLILSLLGMPLAFATLFVGIAGFSFYRGLDASIAVAGQRMMEMSMNYGLSVVPLFILMGTFIHRARISDELYEASYAWLGRLKGGWRCRRCLPTQVCGRLRVVAGHRRHDEQGRHAAHAQVRL